MKRGEKLAFAIFGILFAIFIGNVILGAARLGVFLGDVAEMLVLLGASIAFVVAVLMQERRTRSGNVSSKKTRSGGETQ